VQTQEWGGAGGAQPPLNCLTHLNAALHCKDQAAISEMVEQELWGAEGAQPPLNCSHYIGYNFNACCPSGSAPFSVIRRITPTCSVEMSGDERILQNTCIWLQAQYTCLERCKGWSGLILMVVSELYRPASRSPCIPMALLFLCVLQKLGKIRDVSCGHWDAQYGNIRVIQKTRIVRL